MGMEFVNAYDSTNLVKQMAKEGKLDCYEFGDNSKYRKVYVAEDTHDMQIYRILEGLTYDYEDKEDSFIVENNKIDKWKLLEKVLELDTEEIKAAKTKLREKYVISPTAIKDRVQRGIFFDLLSPKTLIAQTLILDDEDGLSNWEYKVVDSMEDAVEMIDTYGIIEDWDEVETSVEAI